MIGPGPDEYIHCDKSVAELLHEFSFQISLEKDKSFWMATSIFSINFLVPYKKVSLQNLYLTYDK